MTTQQAAEFLNVPRPYLIKLLESEQIPFRLAVTELPHVTMQIVPFRSGVHSAAGGPFSILRFDGWNVPDVVSLEQLDSATYLGDRQVPGYRTIWDQLAVEAAKPDESKETLRALLRIR